MKLALFSLFFPSAMALVRGDMLPPNVSAKNQNGKIVRLDAFKGKYLLVYFYPKDETPGCTREAESLREHYAEIKKLGGEVVGVSRQDEKSHQEFIAKHNLPFDLLVDPDGAIGKSLGVDPIPVIGLHKRKSLLIGPDGKVLKFYADVNPAQHAQEVVADIKSFKQNK